MGLLNEALRYVPGISMETGEGHRDEVFIRGQESTADFYIDGLRDDAQYYRSLYNIERVEVLKGANALIFGRGAGGGAINRVAKRAKFSGQQPNVFRMLRGAPSSASRLQHMEDQRPACAELR